MKKNMKSNHFMWMLFAFFCVNLCVSCDKEDTEPLALHHIDNNSFRLFYGTTDGVTIIGGDGKYSFTCDSPLIKGEMTHSNYILFEALGIGDAVVTIKDESGHTYILTVSITYRTENFVVSGLNATVVGDKMTVGAQKELKEKALATIPVKIGGRYKFVYTEFESQDVSKGVVSIYSDENSHDAIEGTFERVKNRDANRGSFYTYILHYEDNNRIFIFMLYSEPVKSIERPRIQFAEDLKKQFITDYPEVKKVYTSQILSTIIYE